MRGGGEVGDKPPFVGKIENASRLFSPEGVVTRTFRATAVGGGREKREKKPLKNVVLKPNFVI